MPELAEVEYYRKQWALGIGDPILRIALHSRKRIFRGTAVPRLRASILGAALTHAEARGKQLLFRFSDDVWLGLHLGMTGRLTVASPGVRPGKHDHLVLYQAARALVFTDPRQFGRVRFDTGQDLPAWWAKLPPAVNSAGFNRTSMQAFLQRHRKLAIKSTLLLQSGFPGLGNWMADEILWQAKIHPLAPASSLSDDEIEALWRSLQFVCRGALRNVGKDFSDPPKGWLFHERWGAKGQCPVHQTPLQRQTIGGRTTAWCPECQSF